jgi:hypothetical protein
LKTQIQIKKGTLLELLNSIEVVKSGRKDDILRKHLYNKIKNRYLSAQVMNTLNRVFKRYAMKAFFESFKQFNEDALLEDGVMDNDREED